MKIKKIVFILLGITLVSFGIGFLNLNLNNEYLNIKSMKPFGFFVNKNNKNFKDGTEINEEKTIKMNGINSIYIDSHMGNLNIISEDREDIKIHYHGNISKNNTPMLKTEKKMGKIVVTAHIKNFNHIKNSSLTLDIYLPKNYKNDIEGKLSAGNINASEIKIDNLTLTSHAGNIILNNALATNIETSTNAGNIKINLDELRSNISANTNAGNVKITIPEASDFSLDASVSLGNIECDFPIDNDSRTNVKGIVGNGEYKIELKTDMGNLNINSK
ncbi:MAG: DUF4097 domain-containing protein [Clostridiaceae bacterium]|nr:DUF4097 domain-containing protein [Clostridiaceae bacterium]MBW4858999.1 DUF4097 domain-containing protein [Clostridiaceae bacterium]MBW4869574.1 DUF4097 domain-containing protein [Clostridiaceae bacterium]